MPESEAYIMRCRISRQTAADVDEFVFSHYADAGSMGLFQVWAWRTLGASSWC